MDSHLVPSSSNIHHHVLHDHIGTSTSSRMTERLVIAPYQIPVSRKRRQDHVGGIQYVQEVEVREPELSYEANERAAKQYVENIARKYGEQRANSANLGRVRAPTADSDSPYRIRKRLNDEAVGSCDVDMMSCGVPMCGRSFESLDVLAYHMSYAHHDLSTRSNRRWMCLVCGLQLDTIKGRTAHLISKHRAISQNHNDQCMLQRDSIISPHAPAAMRLHYDVMDDAGEMYDLNVGSNLMVGPYVLYDEDGNEIQEIEEAI